MSVLEVQRPPSVLAVPDGRVGSYVDDVGEVAENLGRTLEPEQYLAVDALTAYGKRGKFLTIEAGIEGPRQSTGKTGGVMLPIILWTCITDPDLVTWTSHLADTHLASFRGIAGLGPKDDAGLINECAWLSRRVRSVSWENGSEAVLFRNGATLAFRCRSAKRGRGTSGNTNFADEALFLDAEAMGAMLPTLATRSLLGNARQYYASSGPKGGPESAYLRSLIRRARAGDPTLTWVGWRARGSWANPGCVQDGCGHELGVSGCALDDEDRWAEANILLGRRTSVEFLRTMRSSLPPIEFGREFLGWGEGDDVIDLEVWRGLADPGSRPERRPVALAVDVAPRQRSAAVLVAARRPDGLVHVEILEHRKGTVWLAEFLRGLQRDKFRGVKVRHLGGRAPVMSVVPKLVAAGVQVQVMSDVEFAAACGGLVQIVAEHGIRHLGEARLTAAFGAAVLVDSGDGGVVMTRKGSTGDITPAMAAAVAVHDLVGQRRPSILF